jgi:hexosaminidase
LEVLPNEIIIRAPGVEGLFYGMQTLRQLFPASIESPVPVTGDVEWKIPCLRIVDGPRFLWRGLMLDVSRTFMNKNLVKRYIDLLAFYKMNRLHWHLTDDQEWRIEIRKYPELTRVGSKFAEKYNEMGGYYTQAEVQEIVAYAAERNVVVVPEIEMPGHSLAALAAYAGLSCTGEALSIHPFLKGPNIHEEVFCAGNEKVYEFLQDVLTEVITLFPAPFIHIGGDEVPKTRWMKCPKCQARIKAEGLKNENELQGYLVARVNRFLESQNRRLIGWDDILDGTVTPDVAVMYWTRKGGVAPIVRSGHDVILAPTDPCYFDYTYEVNSTARVYRFEPIPSELTTEQAKHILGAQANFWSHLVRGEDGTDRQVFPRLLALAEVLWSPASSRGWTGFASRLEEHKTRLDLMGVKWMREAADLGDIH